jgi:hypothetical protein
LSNEQRLLSLTNTELNSLTRAKQLDTEATQPSSEQQRQKRSSNMRGCMRSVPHVSQSHGLW